MVHDYMIDKVLDKITEVISNEKFYDTTNLINTDGKLSGDITLKRDVTLLTCVIKDSDKFHPYLILDHALYDE